MNEQTPRDWCDAAAWRRDAIARLEIAHGEVGAARALCPKISLERRALHRLALTLSREIESMWSAVRQCENNARMLSRDLDAAGDDQ